MHMEPTIADIVAPNVAFNLSTFFDAVGDPMLYDGHDERGFDGRVISRYLKFSVDVWKYKRRTAVDVTVEVTTSGRVNYPAVITCQRTGRSVNLDEGSIDRVLFNRRPRDER